MTDTDTRDISDLDAEGLLALRTKIDGRLTEIKAEFVEKAAALGLSVVDGNGKKGRKRRSNAHKESD